MSDPANVRSVTTCALAAIALVVADALVRIVPFAVLARRIERHLPRVSRNGDAGFATRRVRWAIAAAQRRIPWTIPCLATAIAANRLLAWRGVPSELWLGVHASGKPSIDAHAWLVAEGCVVTGGGAPNDYVPLHSLITT